MADLKGKVGIVTGGGTGIGRATALAMAKAGAAIVIGNRDAAKGEEVVALIQQAGGRAVFQKTDVSEPDDVKALVDKAVAEFGRLDVAFNNAGIDGEQVPRPGPVETPLLHKGTGGDPHRYAAFVPMGRI